MLLGFFPFLTYIIDAFDTIKIFRSFLTPRRQIFPKNLEKEQNIWSEAKTAPKIIHWLRTAKPNWLPKGQRPLDFVTEQEPFWTELDQSFKNLWLHYSITNVMWTAITDKKYIESNAARWRQHLSDIWAIQAVRH